MIWNLITNIVNTKIIKRKDTDRRKNDNIYQKRIKFIIIIIYYKFMSILLYKLIYK